MSDTLDVRADTSYRDLHRYSKLYSFPDYVKQASAEQIFQLPEDLPSTVFADVRKRQFPCHTKAATWLSYLFFLEKKADIHQKIAQWIEDALNRYADRWGLSGDIERLREKHAELHARDPLPDSAYMLVWAGDNGYKERHYPVTGPASLKQAAAWFEQHRYTFPFEDRLTMANKLLEKASEFGCGFGDETDVLLEKQAGHGSYDPAVVAHHVRNRVKAATRVPREIRLNMSKLADAVVNAPGLAQDPAHCRMLAKTIDDFDGLTHMRGKYSSLIPSPEDVVFPAVWKVARAFVDSGCTLTTGTVYDRSDFSKLALSEVRDLLGDDIASEVSDGLMVNGEKLAEVAATLPRGDAAMLDRVLNDNGINPVIKQATAVPRIGHGELQELAKIDRAARAMPQSY